MRNAERCYRKCGMRNGAIANAEFGVRNAECGNNLYCTMSDVARRGSRLLRSVWKQFILNKGGVYDPRYSGGVGRRSAMA